MSARQIAILVLGLVIAVIGLAVLVRMVMRPRQTDHPMDFAVVSLAIVVGLASFFGAGLL